MSWLAGNTLSQGIATADFSQSSTSYAKRPSLKTVCAENPFRAHTSSLGTLSCPETRPRFLKGTQPPDPRSSSARAQPDVAGPWDHPSPGLSHILANFKFNARNSRRRLAWIFLMPPRLSSEAPSSSMHFFFSPVSEEFFASRTIYAAPSRP